MEIYHRSIIILTVTRSSEFVGISYRLRKKNMNHDAPSIHLSYSIMIRGGIERLVGENREVVGVTRGWCPRVISSVSTPEEGRQAVSIFIDTLLHRHERGSSVMRCRGHGARFIYNRVGQKRALRRDARVEYYARVLRRPHAATGRKGVTGIERKGPE